MSLSGFDTPKLPPRRREHAWTGRVLCFAACVLAVNALIGERGLSETLRARREFNAAVVELSRLQYENATLAETIYQLRHDAPTIENVARGELGLIRPGEILVVLKQSTRPVSISERPESERPEALDRPVSTVQSTPTTEARE